ncbi:MAG: hypothetical protein EBU57_08020, partial [Alphaproteobacteria bacterium]|nr:hypothetical protein [Alphaproteobacteria bacterium]
MHRFRRDGRYRDVVELLQGVAAFADTVGQFAHHRFDPVDRIADGDAQPVRNHQADGGKDADTDQVSEFGFLDARSRGFAGEIALFVRVIDQGLDFFVNRRVHRDEGVRDDDGGGALLLLQQRGALLAPGLDTGGDNLAQL